MYKRFILPVCILFSVVFFTACSNEPEQRTTNIGKDEQEYANRYFSKIDDAKVVDIGWEITDNKYGNRDTLISKICAQKPKLFRIKRNMLLVTTMRYDSTAVKVIIAQTVKKQILAIIDTLSFEEKNELVSCVNKTNFGFENTINERLLAEFCDSLKFSKKPKNLPTGNNVLYLFNHNKKTYSEIDSMGKICDTTDQIILAYYSKELSKLTTWEELLSFKASITADNDFFNGITRQADSLILEMRKQVLRDPKKHSFASLLSFTQNHEFDEYIPDEFYAVMVKKAPDYASCKVLLTHTLPENSSVWRLCDTKAQRFLDLEASK